MNPLVSIIIPVKNGQKIIRRCLDSLKALNYPNYEIIVVDDNSSDETRQILTSYSGIQVIETSGIGPSGCRNLGIKLSKGEYLAFTDADCLVHSEWLNELLKGFVSVETVGVGGDQQSPEDETEFGKMVQGFLKVVGFVADYVKKGDTPTSPFKFIPTNHNPSCNVMYRKEIFNKIGGFLEGLWPGEDVELDYRIKKLGKLIYNPRAIVYHYRPDNLWKFCQMIKRYGDAQGFLVKRYGAFRLIHYEPIFLVILVVAVCVTGVFGLCFCFFVPLFYLFARAKSIKKTLQFSRLLVMTIIYWNLGFIRGLMKKCVSG